jgi:hypothetical protein
MQGKPLDVAKTAKQEATACVARQQCMMRASTMHMCIMAEQSHAYVLHVSCRCIGRTLGTLKQTGRVTKQQQQQGTS